MHTESTYYQGRELSLHSLSVFVAVLLIHGGLAHPLTGVFDQLRGSYDHRRLHVPSVRYHSTQ